MGAVGQVIDYRFDPVDIEMVGLRASLTPGQESWAPPGCAGAAGGAGPPPADAPLS
jgi:hypothetical protein